MAFIFKKNIVVGVSVTPEIGLEIAQIDFDTRTVLKYGSKQLAYDGNRREIADLDIFKDTLQELLFEMDIPKGSEIVLNIPSPVFRINDYPASLNAEQVSNVVEEELFEFPFLKDSECAVSIAFLPNSTLQFNKVAYTAAQKGMLIEIAMQIKELGYTLAGIETSVNSTLNTLIYCERINVSPEVSWVMLQVENNCCRVIPMQGRNYVDCFEERVSIGEVLGDAENYSTVVNAVSPVLKNHPSQYLYIVSKTSIISAEVLASKLLYNAPIIHQEANCFTKEAFIDCAETVEPDLAKRVSPDVIGAAIFKYFAHYSNSRLDLFNKTLGDVYILEQPPVLNIGSFGLVFSLDNCLKLLFVLFIVVAVSVSVVLSILVPQINLKKQEIKDVEAKIAETMRFLKDNESISSSLFDEGDEVRIGVIHNKDIYSFYTIVGTEIPKKLWLTGLTLGKDIIIEGQADNLESVYSFFRNIKDYKPESGIKLQKLGLASKSALKSLTEDGNFDTDSILTSMNADFYQFVISDSADAVVDKAKSTDDKKKKNSSKSGKALPALEIIE